MKKKIKSSLKKILVLAITLFVAGQSLLSGAISADSATSPFYSTAGDGIAYNLFYIDELEDMYVSVITMGQGGEVAFCVSKTKYFPSSSGIEYSTSDNFTWTTDVDGNESVTSLQAQQVKNTIYNYNFVYPSKLADYGLAGDDMSLYAATSIVIWLIVEGYELSDLKYKSGMTAAEEAIADKQMALITDMYNDRNTTTTYVSGGRLYDNTNKTDAADTYDITSDYVYLIDGVYYYRTPLLSLVPNQLAGYAYSGENAFTYTVTLSDTSSGAFIASANSTNLGTSATIGLDNYYGNRFYVYVPITATPETLTVNVETTTFSRMDVALWNPTSNSRYQSIVKNMLVDDTASDSVTLTWDAVDLSDIYVYDPQTSIAATASVSVTKVGYAIEGHETTDTDYGTLYTLDWSDTEVALEGAQFMIISGSTITDGLDIDIDLYANAPLFRYSVSTDSNGRVAWSNVITDQTTDTTYRIAEFKAPDGYVISDYDATATLNGQEYYYKEVTVGSSTNYEGSVTVTNNLITFSFELQKVDQYGDAVVGAVFGLYTTEEILTDDGVIPAGSLVGIYTTDENGEISDTPNLPATQDYTLVELEAPDGYTMSSVSLTVKATDATTADGDLVDIVNESGNVVTVVTNTKDEVEEETPEEEDIVTNITIIKTDSETGELLEGAEFTLYYQSDEDLSDPIAVVMTNADGIASFTDLAPGAYVIYETNAPDGYIAVDGKVIAVDTTDAVGSRSYSVGVENTPIEEEVEIEIIVPDTAVKWHSRN